MIPMIGQKPTERARPRAQQAPNRREVEKHFDARAPEDGRAPSAFMRCIHPGDYA
jgi:hypothetical protein